MGRGTEAGLVLASMGLLSVLSAAQESLKLAPSQPQAPLPLAQVVQNLEVRNAHRASALERLEGERTYRMQYRGFPGDRDAEMVVSVVFQAPNSKDFRIISQSGSQFVIDHVFKKLLEGEQEAVRAENQRQSALTRANYDFELAGYESSPEGGTYILNLIPRTKNKFLYRGKIWVDGNDFAVVRIEAEPGKNPSMWIKRTEISHTYTKVNDFWLPAANRTVSSTRFGGTATLTINYRNYRTFKVSSLRASRTAPAIGAASLLDGRLAVIAPAP